MNKQDAMRELFFKFEQNEKVRVEKLGKSNPKIIYDGYVSTPEEFDASDRILFIASESNDLDGERETAFWVKRVINNDPEIKNRKERIIKSINRLHTALQQYMRSNYTCEHIISELKTDGEWTTNYDGLKNIAYINLKKTGGTGEVNDPKTIKKDGIDFIGWIDAHKELISKQIKIIDPKIIIVCGNQNTQPAFETICNEYPLSSDIVVLYAYHPSPRGKSDEQLLRDFFERERNKDGLLELRKLYGSKLN